MSKKVAETKKISHPSSLFSVPRWVPAVILAAFAAVIVKAGWVADQSLVTLRTSLNSYHGWGPTFNPSDMKQTFDSPLWFMLWSLVGTATGEWVTTMFVMSFILSFVAVGVVLYRAFSIPALVGVTAALLLSNTFMDFTTSGMEQALTFVLVAAVFLTVHQALLTKSAGWGAILGFLCALMTLGRFDLIFLLGPLVLMVVWVNRKVSGYTLTVAGMFAAPLALWFGWAHFTYGTFFPEGITNKIRTSSFTELVQDGGSYLWGTATTDPVTAFILVAGVLTLLLKGRRRHQALAVGVILYTLWVVGTGGNDLSGQLLAAPVFVTVLAFADGYITQPKTKKQLVVRTGTVTAVSLIAATTLVVLGMTPTVVNVWGVPATQESPRYAAAENHRTFVELIGGVSDQNISEFTPFQSAAFLKNYDGPVTIISIREAARMWPNNTGQITSLDGAQVAQCDRQGVNGMLSGPEVEWETSCTK